MFTFGPASRAEDGPNPLWANVTVLLKMDGSHGATPITDSSSFARAFTVAGTSPTLSNAQAKFGPTSMIHTGATGHFVSASATNMDFGTADFTVEGWIYPTSLPAGGEYRGIIGRRSSGAVQLWAFTVNGDNSGKVYFEIGNSGGTSFGAALSATAPAINTWSHVAACRSGNNLTVYLNGVGGTPLSLVGQSFSAGTINMAVGVMSYAATGFWIGHLDEIRVSKNTCLYVGNFTPRTSPFPVG